MALNINGTTGISGVDGSSSAPAVTGTDSNTGINFGSDILIFNTGGIERSRFDANGNLLIGTTSFNNGNFTGSGHGITIGGTAPQITLHQTGSNTDSFFGNNGTNAYLYTADSMNMVFGTSDAERLRILSGGGITFNGDTATANALDDYEEGTFNAPYYEGGTQVTTADGKYTKIGNRVMISIFEFAYGGASNKNITYITGLPFAAHSQPNSVGTICRYGGGNHRTIDASEACYIAQGGTQIKFNSTFASGSGNWTCSLVYEAA